MPKTRNTQSRSRRTRNTRSKGGNVIDTVKNGAAGIVDFTGDVVNEFVNTVLGTVGGVVDGVSTLTDATSDIFDKVVHDVVGVRTAQLFKGAGDIAFSVSEKLGDVIDEVPLLGGAAAYVVRRAGDGVYHVVLSVGTLAESSTRYVGNTARKATDLVVFTLSGAKQLLLEAGSDVTETVNVLTSSSRRKSSKKSASVFSRKSQSGGGAQRRSRRLVQRGGRPVLPAEYFGGDSGVYTAGSCRQPFQTAYGSAVPTSFGESVPGMEGFRGPNLAPGGTYATNTASGLQTGGGGADAAAVIAKYIKKIDALKNEAAVSKLLEKPTFQRYVKSISETESRQNVTNIETLFVSMLKENAVDLTHNHVVGISALEIILSIAKGDGESPVDMAQLYEAIDNAHARELNDAKAFAAAKEEEDAACREACKSTRFAAWGFGADNVPEKDADLWYGIKLQVKHDMALRVLRGTTKSDVQRDVKRMATIATPSVVSNAGVQALPRIPYLFTIMNNTFPTARKNAEAFLQKVSNLMLVKQIAMLQLAAEKSRIKHATGDYAEDISSLLSGKKAPKSKRAAEAATLPEPTEGEEGTEAVVNEEAEEEAAEAKKEGEGEVAKEGGEEAAKEVEEAATAPATEESELEEPSVV